MWAATAAQAQAPTDEAPAKPVLQLKGLSISPSKPGVDTLCKLRVTLSNSSPGVVSALRFDVSVGGTSLAVYERQVFMDALEPGKETEVELFNFWTTETGRPAPKDGKLAVTVSLREARSTTISTDDSGTETWTVGDPISALPSATTTTLVLVPPKP